MRFTVKPLGFSAVPAPTRANGLPMTASIDSGAFHTIISELVAHCLKMIDAVIDSPATFMNTS